jgi:protein-S-isoprenylcysteine O-methyltransferase Ste14
MVEKDLAMTLTFVNNPFFWALVSMFGLVGACAVVGSQRIGSRPHIGWVIVLLFFDLGRVLLVLPFVEQPRFEMGGWHGLVGGLIFIMGLIFGLPSFEVKPLNVAEKGMELKTTGLYSIVRNPIYLCEVLWCLGWAIIFRSMVGVALVPLWWAGLLFLIFIEEESLERALGEPYRAYKQRVRGRIIPGLPF